MVKMADRLCNTMDFVRAKNDWGKGYLGLGECLFVRVDEVKFPELVRNAFAEVKAATAR